MQTLALFAPILQELPSLEMIFELFLSGQVTALRFLHVHAHRQPAVSHPEFIYNSVS